MKKYIAFIYLIALSINAQNNTDNYDRALEAYKNHEFGTAYQLLRLVSGESTLEKEKLASVKFYISDCLINLNQLDGAASELEEFLDNYKFSNFSEDALYKLGTVYYKKGEYRRSRERLLLLLTEYPLGTYTGSANYWIGECYFAENKYVEAEEYFREAIAQKSTNRFIENSIFSLAQLYEKTNDYSNAVANYDELLAYFKDSPLAPKAQLRIAICYFNLKQYDSAIIELTDPFIQKLPPDELIDSKFFLANAYMRLKQYNDATRIYKELLTNLKDESYKEKINYSLAWVSFQQEKYDDAYLIFKALSEEASDTMKAISLFWSGECKRYLGDIKGANEIFKEFITKYPDNKLASRAQLGLGALVINQTNSNDGDKALLNAALSGDASTKGKAYTLLGELRLNKKKYDEAKKYFSQALQLTASQPDLNNRARLGMAVASFYLNDYDISIKNLEDLKERNKQFESDKVNFYLAESYFYRSKYSSAVKYYNLISAAPEEMVKESILGKAYSYFNLKDFQNAAFYFNEFISKYKNDPIIIEAKLRLADSYFGTKKFDKASAVYKELFSKEKTALNNDLAYFQYGQSLFKSGNSDAAVEAMLNLQKKFPQSKYADQSQYIIGWINFQQNKFKVALENYNLLLNKYPKSALRPVVYYSIGDSYFNLGNYDSSIIYYSKVISDFAGTQYVFDAVNGIQYAYVAKDEPDKAIGYIDQFLAANPNAKSGDQIFFKKGDLYYSIGKFDKAITAYKDFISKYPSSSLVAGAYYWIGKSAANMKNETDAINNFQAARQRALKTEIGISSAIELSSIYMAKKQYSSAVNILKEAIDAQPSSNRVAELLYLQGINLEKDNKQTEAYSAFDQIINNYEGSLFVAKAKVELGIIELQRNNFDKAQSYLKEVGETRLDDIGAQAQYLYGLSLFNQNRMDEAITALVRVRSVFVAFDEWYTKSLLKLGDCYVKMKDNKQARELYKAVLSRHQNDEYSKEAKKKLNQL
jgi:TolA-binding protein